MDTLCKQIVEPNIKVSLNALNIFEKIYDPLKTLVENNLGMICNSIFSTVNSSKV